MSKQDIISKLEQLKPVAQRPEQRYNIKTVNNSIITFESYKKNYRDVDDCYSTDAVLKLLNLDEPNRLKGGVIRYFELSPRVFFETLQALYLAGFTAHDMQSLKSESERMLTVNLVVPPELWKKVVIDERKRLELSIRSGVDAANNERLSAQAEIKALIAEYEALERQEQEHRSGLLSMEF